MTVCFAQRIQSSWRIASRVDDAVGNGRVSKVGVGRSPGNSPPCNVVTHKGTAGELLATAGGSPTESAAAEDDGITGSAQHRGRKHRVSGERGPERIGDRRHSSA